MSSRINQMLDALKWNVYTALHIMIHHRDKNTILVGAWMGTKFADNSRYLYQYLYENKHILGLKHVVWVTRNPEVNDMLNKMGYESYIVGTKESTYWHLKAGMHIVCNASNDIPNFHADIDTRLSLGAKKIQLWHGVGGIKAVGLASNEAKSLREKSSPLKKILHTKFCNTIFSQGGWVEARVLAPGKECAAANVAYIGCREDRIFVTGYPRNCECLRLLDKEKEIIDFISKYSGRILYLPTFRSDNSNYVHPLQDSAIRNFIERNNILWIEKPHTADLKNDAIFNGSQNILNLTSDFDINTIYRYMDCIMTDYSSVAFDAVYHAKPLIMYTPDLEDFRNGDIGFFMDFESYFSDMLCMNTEEVTDMIYRIFTDPGQYLADGKKSYRRINQYSFDNQYKSYTEIWNDIKAI